MHESEKETEKLKNSCSQHDRRKTLGCALVLFSPLRLSLVNQCIVGARQRKDSVNECILLMFIDNINNNNVHANYNSQSNVSLSFVLPNNKYIFSFFAPF